eukprot:TRINITY_DN1097_c0_g1_i1.p1 TRINITY_DN1097_c0_g1~~TRINITY_DN1097_c0_g1_i1.p1  ORF type:complete len:348 (-),score=48.19 TRINITY_DN1097_c0_g1_i1:41-1084(-)
MHNVPLHWAAEHVDAFASERFVADVILERSPPSHINMQNNRGETPLHYAIIRTNPTLWATINQIDRQDKEKRHLNFIKNLLKRGADTNILSKNGLSPLMLACAGTNPKLCLTLLKHPGTDVTLKDAKTDETCLHKFFRSLVAENQKTSRLRKLLLKEFLIRAPQLINQTDKDGYTPLMVACTSRKLSKSNLQILKFAFNYEGTDLNVKNPFTGDTLLHMICSDWTLPLHDLFFDSDTVKADLQNRSILFMLLQANRKGDRKELSSDAKADPTLKNKAGKTCFDILPNLKRLMIIFNALYDGPKIELDEEDENNIAFNAPRVPENIDMPEMTQQQLLFSKLRFGYAKK